MMKIQVELGPTSLTFEFQPNWSVPPERQKEAAGKVVEALGPTLSSLTVVLHSGTASPAHLAVTATFLQTLLHSEVGRLAGYIQRLEMGTISGEDLIQEILETAMEQNGSDADDDDPFRGAIDNLDLNI